MDTNDSPSGPEGSECIICLKKIGDFPYATINKVGETGKYHVECLEEWLNKSHNKGVLRQDTTESYSLYQNDQLIETVYINKKDRVIEISEIPSITTSESESLLNSEIIYEPVGLCDCNGSTKASFVCAVIVTIIIAIYFLYRFLSK